MSASKEKPAQQVEKPLSKLSFSPRASTIKSKTKENLLDSKTSEERFPDFGKMIQDEKRTHSVDSSRIPQFSFGTRPAQNRDQSGTSDMSYVRSSRHVLPIQGADDDIDIFITNFERMAHVYQWKKERWVAYLLPVLNAKCQTVHAGMNLDECQNYDLFKKALMISFDHNPEHYRKLFTNVEQLH